MHSLIPIKYNHKFSISTYELGFRRHKGESQSRVVVTLMLDVYWIDATSGLLKPAVRSLHHDDCNDHTVKSDTFSKNEDQDHTHEDAICLGVSTHSSITGHTNC